MTLLQRRIADAKEEAERFLRRVEEWDKTDTSMYASKEIAAIKRASMDLTRALAQVRKGNW